MSGEDRQRKKSTNSLCRPLTSMGLEKPKPKREEKPARFKSTTDMLKCFTKSSSPLTSVVPERKRITIWPEWNDNDVNSEKWETAGTLKWKDEKKGKSPVVPAYYEDPDGKLELPPSLRAAHWIRAHEMFADDRVPVVVDVDRMTENFDLLSNNRHLHGNELLRYFISMVITLWELCAERSNSVKSHSLEPHSLSDDHLGSNHNWRPWEHIYSLSKAVKNHVPLYNPYGKYIVRLYWMGCWRKIQVDDLLPFDENNQLLLPTTTHYELWPMLLAKGIMKVASLDFSLANSGVEFGDMRILHYLTGWLPEAIPLHTPPSVSSSQVLDTYYSLLKTRKMPLTQCAENRQSHKKETWELLKALLPEWRLPEAPETCKAEEEVIQVEAVQTIGRQSFPAINVNVSSNQKVEDVAEVTKDAASHTRAENERGVHKTDRPRESLEGHRRFHKEKHGKEEKKEKNEKHKDKDKDRREKVIPEEVPVIPEHPEVVIFANFGVQTKPDKVSELARMADASERLRKNGLSHLYPHPVCITQTRSISMELPPPQEYVPPWKLIRPRKKKEHPTDEPKEEESPQEIQCLEITSPFISYDVSPMYIPSTFSRLSSCLERGTLRRKSNFTSMPIKEQEEFETELEGLPEQHSSHIPSLGDLPVLREDVEELEDDRQVVMDYKQLMVEGDQKRLSSLKHKSAKRDKIFETENIAASGKAAKGTRDSFNVSKHDQRGKKRKSDARMTVGSEDKKDLGKDEQRTEDTDVDTDAAANPHVVAAASSFPRQNSRWIDFDEFCICFRVLYIYHKPATYMCNQRYSDFKALAPTTPSPYVKMDKKQAAAAPGVLVPEDKSCHFLFVDSLKPAEIVVAFSVIPRWFDFPPSSATEDRKSAKPKDKEINMDTTGHFSITSMQEQALLGLSQHRDQVSPVVPPIVSPGYLVAEPFSWKSLVTGQPVMKLRTTGIKAAVLCLPPGRHVLKFMMTSPLAHHVHLCATQPFVFGDEETVMPHLVHESCRFKNNAAQTIIALGKCLTVFSDSKQQDEAHHRLEALYCPFAANKALSRRRHYQYFNEALFSMLRRGLRDVATPDMALAWRAFTMDFTTFNILGLPLGLRPDSSSAETPATSGRGSGKPAIKKHMDNKQSSEPEKTESVWLSKYTEPSAEEQATAVKIQKTWRGYWVRKVKRAAIQGTPENTKAQEQLLKSWAALEPSPEDHGLYLFRELFRKTPDSMQYYPFCNDEWNRVAYADYRGVYADQPAKTWFVVFRDVFYVREQTLAVPKLYIPLPTCMLRVIDNDTGDQLPTVFQKVAPYVYKPNGRGYTFVAEARTLNTTVPSGAWRLRLIGAFNCLPAPRTSELTTSFHSREIQDYYMPNPKDILFRYYVKMSSDQASSLQVSTSKADVLLKVCVMDSDELVASVTGKGHVVIPAILFQKTVDDTITAPSSFQETRGSRYPQRTGSGKGIRLKKTTSKTLVEDRSTRDSHSQNMASDQGFNDVMEDKQEVHKYLVQATVLKNSWPLTEEELTFITKLKEEEKNEQKAFYFEDQKSTPGGSPERQLTPQKVDKPADPKKYKSKSKSTKDKEPLARSTLLACDPDRPSWILRIVVDAAAADDLEVKKDTERADEIRAIKKAWEEAEPGRAARARKSRLQFLETRPAVQQLAGEGGDTTPPPTSTTLNLPDSLAKEIVCKAESADQSSKQRLQPIEWTAYLRFSQEKGVLVDKRYEEGVVCERQEVINQYLAYRQQVERWRAQDRATRNQAKLQQLFDTQALQLMVDKKREAVNLPREAFRQVYLEAERKREKELAQQEVLLRAAEMEAKATEKTRKNGKAKKKK